MTKVNFVTILMTGTGVCNCLPYPNARVVKGTVLLTTFADAGP